MHKQYVFSLKLRNTGIVITQPQALDRYTELSISIPTAGDRLTVRQSGNCVSFAFLSEEVAFQESIVKIKTSEINKPVSAGLCLDDATKYEGFKWSVISAKLH